MSCRTGLGGRAVAPVALATFMSLIGNAAMAESIQGTATYRERMALPPGAVFEATLQEVSRADAPAETIATTRLAPAGNPPSAFTIVYDPGRQYGVRARILLADTLVFTTDTAAPVITRGNPATVSLMLRKTVAAEAAPAGPADARPLEGTYWKAVELRGKPTPAQDPKREAHLRLQSGGRLSGSDGCNRVTGSYQLKGEAVTFGPIAGTQMACLDTGEIERAFRDALKRATRLKVAGDRLELFDAAGDRMAGFVAGSEQTPPPPSAPLEGTSWQLVQFKGSDDTTLRPDDGATYTIEFGAGGQLTARIDCTRGRGTWSSSGPNQLQLGPLALTRAQCPPESLHDRIVKHWQYVRSYVTRDGHLFLALMADGGIYEFEPLRKIN